MDATPLTADEFLKSFMLEIDALDENATNAAVTTPPSQNASSKKRKRTTATSTKKTKQENNIKPGWVPKPPDDCPIVSWTENENLFAVQNPTNSGPLLLKMEIYDSENMLFRCGLFLDRDSEVYNYVLHLVNKVENMWIDKPTGIPKIGGLTQTVTPCATTTTPATKPTRSNNKKKKTSKARLPPTKDTLM